MRLAERIDFVMKHHDWSQAELARQAGTSRQTVQNWCNGKTRELEAATAATLESNSDFAALWLSVGQGDRFKKRKSERSIQAPVIGKGSGGIPERIWTDADLPVGGGDEYFNVTTRDNNAFVVRVVGVSMSPRYEPGEYALVEPNEATDIGDDVLVRLTSGEVLLKRLASKQGGIRLISVNGSETIHLQHSEVSWMYHVAHVLRPRSIKQRSP